jgi:hypothetical protein
MMKRFALPADKAGYFCKVCGEKLFDANNVGEILFLGMPGSIGMSMGEDDALQTMIWKEAMYIVSSNVRFTEPIPIKPLVSSLANGLKSVVAAEEAKLFRSKTNSSDTVRDTLNLYASIYIYAALCAIMINNPGKLTFAREKPADQAEKEKKLESIELKKVTNKPANAANKLVSRFVNKTNIEKTTNNTVVESDVEKATDVDADVESDVEKDQNNTFGYSSDLEMDSNADSNVNSNVGKTDIPDVVPAVATAAGERNKRINKNRHNRKTSKNNTTKHTNKAKKHLYVHGGKMVATDNTKKASANIIKNALVLLIISKESIISRSKNINIPIIRNMFSTAFKWASDHAKPIHFDRDVDRQLQQDPFYNDPFYIYLHHARLMSYFANGGFAPGINDVFNLLGRHREQIITELKENDIDIYSTMPEVKAWPNLATYITDPEYKKFFNVYTYQSFVSVYEFMKNKIYQNSFIPKHVQVIDHLEKFKYLLQEEKKVKAYHVRQNLRPSYDFGIVMDVMRKYNRFEPTYLDLAQHFCPSGENHKAGSYIYVDSKSKTFEITKKDILEWLDKKDTEKLAHFNTLDLVNERCALCKNTIRDGKSSDKSSKALSIMFKNIDDVLAFYQYYETRCPKGNLHDIIDNKCTKCGFLTDYSKKSELEYYNKYVALFRKIQLEQQQITIKSLDSLKEVSSDVDKPTKTDKPNKVDYHFTLKKTSEWSRLYGIKYNVIVNIGLSEGVKHSDIENAKINPSKEAYSYRSRALKFKGYIYNILREYTLFLNHDNVVELPLQL